MLTLVDTPLTPQSSNVIGGGINLAFNSKNTRAGGLAPDTYLVFVALMAVAPFVTLFLSNPGQVQRKDRTPVPAFPSGSIRTEFVETMKTLKSKKVWARECNVSASTLY